MVSEGRKGSWTLMLCRWQLLFQEEEPKVTYGAAAVWDGNILHSFPQWTVGPILLLACLP
jgi:hypothetical protein